MGKEIGLVARGSKACCASPLPSPAHASVSRARFLAPWRRILAPWRRCGTRAPASSRAAVMAAPGSACPADSGRRVKRASPLPQWPSDSVNGERRPLLLERSMHANPRSRGMAASRGRCTQSAAAYYSYDSERSLYPFKSQTHHESFWQYQSSTPQPQTHSELRGIPTPLRLAARLRRAAGAAGWRKRCQMMLTHGLPGACGNGNVWERFERFCCEDF